ncbi:MAG: Hint domain-containing protein [Alphaproteobacteria bacterium]|nr:Hint domain-containing protein [Alphaproteobacteria bacterium]
MSSTRAVFEGLDDANKDGVWVTDGTAAGTSEPVVPGQESNGPFSELNPSDLTLFGTKLLFAGNDSRGKEGLWITDGTAAGTTEIFAPPLTWSGLNPHAFTVSGNEAYFLGQGANRQVGVWVTDGTTAGTSEVNVPHASLGGLNPQEIVSFNPLCFLNGTRIATPSGETLVQDLRAGDMVLTADGVAVPVRWIGERRIDLTRHPDPAAASPIRIRRGAFGPDVPRRDLLVSPDHAMLLDGLLIPERLLVNGATILRETRLSAVHYFHVELEGHGILLAEGAASESYLDTGNRGMFDNAGVPLVLHPDFLSHEGQAIRERDSCAPFAVDATRVRPVWGRLADRAGEFGYALPAFATRSDPDLRIVMDGREIRPVSVQSGEYVFALPGGHGEVRLLSRAAAPCDTAPWIDDRRRLGVMVRRIAWQAGGEHGGIAPDDPSLAEGWWEAEGDAAGPWRWTNGDAALPLPDTEAPALLRLLCNPAAYPLADHAEPRVSRAA